VLHITTTALTELPLIHELGKQTFYPTYLPFITKAQVDYMFHKMYDLPALQQQVTERKHTFLLARLDKRPVGFISYEKDINAERACKVHKLYVLPGTQGHGIGKALLDRVMLDGLAAGQQSIWLNVNRFNKAVEFYKHLGFEIVAEDDIDIGHGFYMNDYEMKKTLSAG